MTRSPHQTTGHIPHQTLAGLVLTLALALVPIVSLRADAPPTSLRISNTGHDLEGLQTFQLGWDALSNATYLVQSADSLATGSPWQTLDAVQSPDKAGSYQLSVVATDSTGLSSAPAKFYRLVLPQPQIFSVEPAVVAPGVAVDVYVLGQSFDTNDVLLINGVPQTNVVFQSSSLLSRPAFTPDVAGTYVFELVVAGQVVSSFNVTCADPLANPELVLQGPPTEPPASPSKKDFKGHVTLMKAFDDGSDDNLEGKKDFKGHVTLLKAFDDGSDGESARTHTKTGHVTLMKAFDDGSGDARTGGGGDPKDDDCDGFADAVNTTAGEVCDPGNDDDDDVGVDFNHWPVISGFSGEVQQQVVDLAIPGRGLDFVWARTYNSRIGRSGTSVNGWTFSYDVNIQPVGGDILIHDGTGRADTFKLQTNGTYTCPEFFREGTISNNTFTLTFADTGRWVFNPFDGSAAAGKLISIITRNGDTMTLGYDTSGRLAQIVDDLGRTNTVGYNSSGQLASVTDFSGRTVTYQYYQGQKGDNGGAGDLKSVTSPPVTGTPDGNDFPDGKTVTYTYSHGYANDAENHLLLSVIDAKGQTACTHVYQHNQTDFEFLRCISVQHGTNTPAVFTYLPQTPAPSNHFAALRCVMNDPVGDVTESFCDTRNRCVTERDYTGRATPGLAVTDTDNRPTGKLRSDDPDYYECRADWNNDSLCSRLYLFGGQQVQCVYQSDFDPATPARKRADLRVVHEFATVGVDTDGDGVPDTTELTTTFQYDPRFGSDRLIIIAGVSVGYTYAKRAAIMDNQRKEVAAVKTLVEQGIAGESAMYVNPRSIARQQYFFNEHCNSSDYLTKKQLGNLKYNDFVISTTDSRGIVANKPGSGGTTAGRARGIIIAKPAGGTSGSSAGMSKPLQDWITDGLVPTGSGMAINTKGTGADKNRVAGGGGSMVMFEDLWPNNGDLDFNDQSTAYNFAISVTDPRGNVTTGTYDTNGNCVAVTRGTNGKVFGINIELGLDFVYNNHGQLIAITNAPDANGRSRVDTFSWSQGQITNCVVDAAGLALTSAFQYDARGNLTRCVDPRTNDWLFTYNALDECVRAQSPPNITSRCTTDFSYDANDNLVQTSRDVRDAADNLVGTQVDRASYNGQDCLSEMALAVDASHALTNRFAYDGNDQCVQVLGPDAVSGADPNQTITYQYDERELVLNAIAAPGSSLAHTNGYDYNPNGKIRRFNCELYVETMAFDGFDRLSSVTNPMGNVVTYSFNRAGELGHQVEWGKRSDSPAGTANTRLSECQWQYDGLNRCVQFTEAFFDPATQSPIGSGVAVSTCAYAPNDDCVSETDSLGRTTAYAYDTAGRLSSIADPIGNTCVFALDACDNITSVTTEDHPYGGGNLQAFSTTCSYDHWNRCVSCSDNVGNTSSCAYDSLDQVVRATDPNGNDTTYAYDLLDNCVASTDYAGSSSVQPASVVRTSQATYDTGSRCLTSTDANGNTTSYAYDSMGNCIAVTQPDGTAHTFVWDSVSDLIVEQDANGTTITNTYDLCRNVIHRDLAARGVAVATTTFETFAYDGCSRLVLASNDVSQLTFSYDSFGDCTGSSQDGLAQSATHDSEGNLLSLTYPSGRVVAYSYDALNQVTNIATTGGGVSHPHLAQFAYAGPGRLATIGRDNGINTLVDWDGLVSPANPAGDYGSQQASRVRHGTTASPSLLADIASTYDRMQSKSSQADAVSGRSTTLTFDALDQLVESSVHIGGAPSLDTVYTLDGDGNRQQVITNGVAMPDYTMNSALPPGDFQMNRYTSTPFGDQQYDANGNLVARGNVGGVTYYHYDYADRLVEVDALGGLGTVSPVATFTYDALGDRISKTAYPPSPGAPVTTQNDFDLSAFGDTTLRRAERFNASRLEARVNGVVTTTYVTVPMPLSGRKWEDDSIDVTLAAFPANGQAQYYHYDDLGNTIALTDASGSVLERYIYDDYGQPQFLAADGSPLVDSGGLPVTSSPAGNPYLFHGMEWDAETGLLCDDGNDYFDPQTGRAIRGKVKTVKDMGNGRAFADNNPWSPNSPTPPVAYKEKEKPVKKEFVGHVSLLK